MSEIEGFLEKTKILIGDSSPSLDDVKTALEALRKVSPELVDEQIYERFKSLVDTKELVDGLKVKVDSCVNSVDELRDSQTEIQNKIESLTQTLQQTKESFDGLYQRMVHELESQKKRNDKLTFVLDGLEQYLRRHS
jgi:uncharacterized coiled-coil DUF342 family protein